MRPFVEILWPLVIIIIIIIIIITNTVTKNERINVALSRERIKCCLHRQTVTYAITIRDRHVCDMWTRL